jgi:hypothetical protein
MYKKYTFTLKHDNGTQKISLIDISLNNAIGRITEMEGAPESAILNIKITETFKAKTLKP